MSMTAFISKQEANRTKAQHKNYQNLKHVNTEDGLIQSNVPVFAVGLKNR